MSDSGPTEEPPQRVAPGRSQGDCRWWQGFVTAVLSPVAESSLQRVTVSEWDGAGDGHQYCMAFIIY